MATVTKYITLAYPSSTRTATTYGLGTYFKRFLWEAAAYGGTVEVYFEAVLKSSSAAYTAYAALHSDTGTIVTDSVVSVTGTTTTRVRSTTNLYSILTDSEEYEVRFKSSSTKGTATLYFARLIIIVSGTITALQTDVELQGYGSSLTTSYDDKGSSFYPHDTTKANGTLTCYFEATFYQVSGTAYCALYDTSNNLVSGSEVSSSTTSRQRSGAITLSSGTTYKVRSKCSSGGYTVPMIGTIIIKETNSPTATVSFPIVLATQNTSTSTSYVASSGLFYWDESEWTSATKTVYWESTMKSSNASGIAYAQLYTGSEIAVVSVTGTTLSKIRSSSISPTEHTNHYCQFKSNNASYTATINPCWVVIEATLTETRSLIANIPGASSTSTPVNTTTRKLLSNIPGTSATPATINYLLYRNLLASIIGTSSSPDTVSALLTRALLANIIGSSSAPDTVSYLLTRSLLANIPGSSSTSSITSETIKSLLAAITGGSSTPDTIEQTILRSLIAAIGGTSLSPDTIAISMPSGETIIIKWSDGNAIICYETIKWADGGIYPYYQEATVAGVISLIAAITGSSSTSDAVAYSIIRSLIANLPGISSTPNTIEGLLSRSLVANIPGVSSTPDTVSNIIARSLLAAIVGTSSVANISETMVRSLLGNIPGASTTPNTVVNDLFRNLLANITGASSTPGITYINYVNLLAAIIGQSSTASPTATTIKSLLANIIGDSVTSDALLQELSKHFIAVEISPSGDTRFRWLSLPEEPWTAPATPTEVDPEPPRQLDRNIERIPTPGASWTPPVAPTEVSPEPPKQPNSWRFTR